MCPLNFLLSLNHQQLHLREYFYPINEWKTKCNLHRRYSTLVELMHNDNSLPCVMIHCSSTSNTETSTRGKNGNGQPIVNCFPCVMIHCSYTSNILRSIRRKTNDAQNMANFLSCVTIYCLSTSNIVRCTLVMCINSRL